jgi:hypothetical protein
MFVFVIIFSFKQVVKQIIPFSIIQAQKIRVRRGPSDPGWGLLRLPGARRGGVVWRVDWITVLGGGEGGGWKWFPATSGNAVHSTRCHFCCLLKNIHLPVTSRVLPPSVSLALLV